MSTITDGPQRRRRVGPAARRHPEGQGRVRLLVGHVGRGHAVGRDAALAASPRADPRRSTSPRRSRCRACTPFSPTRTCRGARPTGSSIHDQPVLAFDEVRYQGEPVAIVAADHPETARRAADRIEVAYEELEPLTDPEFALSPDSPPLHPGGNLLRHVHIAHGEEPGEADVVVTGEYEVGMQDQAFLGPGVRARDPRRGRRRRPLHRDPVAARGPRPGRGLRSTCRSRRCASRSPASAARSAGARTSRCRSTRACSRCTPAGR